LMRRGVAGIAGWMLELPCFLSGGFHSSRSRSSCSVSRHSEHLKHIRICLRIACAAETDAVAASGHFRDAFVKSGLACEGMSRLRLTHVLVLVLGMLYVAGGIAETFRVLSSGDGGLAFWFGTLVGGGTLVLLGELAFRERPRLSFGLIAAGCIAGLLPTLWTILVPLFALTVLVLVGLRAGEEVEPRADSPS
jgi:hypothetical protein